eukprot:1786847-Rhodomonas_salina.4
MAYIDEDVYHLVSHGNDSAYALSAVFESNWESYFDIPATCALQNQQVASDWCFQLDLDSDRCPQLDQASDLCPQLDFDMAEHFRLEDTLLEGTDFASSPRWASGSNKSSNCSVSLSQNFQEAETTHQGAKPLSRRNKKPMFWTDEEHERFLVALRRFNGDDTSGLGFGVAELVAAALGNRSVPQIRSHAQKYFSELRKQRQHPPTGDGSFFVGV